MMNVRVGSLLLVSLVFSGLTAMKGPHRKLVGSISASLKSQDAKKIYDAVVDSWKDEQVSFYFVWDNGQIACRTDDDGSYTKEAEQIKHYLIHSIVQPVLEKKLPLEEAIQKIQILAGRDGAVSPKPECKRYGIFGVFGESPLYYIIMDAIHFAHEKKFVSNTRKPGEETNLGTYDNFKKYIAECCKVSPISPLPIAPSSSWPQFSKWYLITPIVALVIAGGCYLGLKYYQDDEDEEEAPAGEQIPQKTTEQPVPTKK